MIVIRQELSRYEKCGYDALRGYSDALGGQRSRVKCAPKKVISN